MSAHTPGPWSVDGQNGFINQIGIGPSIGCAYGAGEEVEANAHLMAAAPKLLEMLSIALVMLEKAEPALGQEDILSGFIEASESVIAKAMGVQS